MLGLSTVAGVGFTVALFVTSLSFDDAALADAAKIGILAGSTLAGVIGFAPPPRLSSDDRADTPATATHDAWR